MTWTHAAIVVLICWIILVEFRWFKTYGALKSHYRAIGEINEILSIYMTPKRKSKDQLEKEKDAKRN